MNVGNWLGERPCVRQTSLYRQRESGNDMKSILGQDHLAWDASPSPARNSVLKSVGDGLRNHAVESPALRSKPQAHACNAGWDSSKPVVKSSGVASDADQDVELRAWPGEARSVGACLRDESPERQACPEAPRARRTRADRRSASSAAVLDASTALARARQARPANPVRDASRDVRSPGMRSPAPRPAEVAARRPGSVPAPSPSRISRSRFDNVRVAPAFDAPASASRFATAYAQGTLPCRINHGPVSNRLSWDAGPSDLRTRRLQLLALCAEGLRELRHPYITIARLAFTDLASLEGCEPIAEDTLRLVMGSLRQALTMESAAASSAGVFEGALNALRQLVKAEGSRVAPFLQMVLPPISKRLFGKGQNGDVVQATLRDLERFGGPEAIKVMRSRGIHAAVR